MPNDLPIKTGLTNILDDANATFDEMCQRRHDMGADKYGSFNFLNVNTLQMAIEEVVDLANYARYTFVKLYVLQRMLESELPNVGVYAFVPETGANK